MSNEENREVEEKSPIINRDDEQNENLNNKADTILFLGKYDDNLKKLEEQVVNLPNDNKSSNDSKNSITIEHKDNELPNVIKYSLTKYDCDAWVIIGDVKPTLLLKDLIKKATIIFLYYNFSQTDSLDFLKDGWSPIVKKAIPDIDKSEKMILIESEPKSEEKSDDTNNNFDTEEEELENIENENKNQDILNKINELKNIFDVKHHFKEYNLNKENYNISQELIEYLQNNLKAKNNESSQQKDDVNNNSKSESKNGQLEEEESDDQDNDSIKDADAEEETQENLGNEKAQNFKDKGKICYDLYEQSKIAHVIKSPEAKGEVFIQTTISYKNIDYNVTKICEKSFSNSQIVELTFSSDPAVRSIGNSAFEGSTITTLFIPKSLTKLEDSWCQGAERLNEIEVDQENRYFSITDGFLYYRKDKKNEILFAPRNFEGEFKVPYDVTRIGDYAFNQRSGLTSIQSSSHSKLRSIGSYSFYKCDGLKNVKFIQGPSLVLGNYCFSRSSNLSDVEISCKALKILDNCFFYCSSLSSFKVTRSTAILLNALSFKGCSSITELSFSNSNGLYIGKECFNDASNLKSVSFNEIREVKLFAQAFKGCKNIENVSITNVSDLFIGLECFSCSNYLKSIKFIADKLTLGNNFVSKCNSLSNVNIQSQSEIIVYTNTLQSSQLKSVILHSPQLKLCSYCFRGLKHLEFIEIETENLEIKDDCFNDCPSLWSFVYKSSKDIKITKPNFINCPSLKKLSLEAKSEIVIPNEFMTASKNLDDVMLKGNRVSVGNLCFKDCVSLKSFTVSNCDHVQFGDYQFKNCKMLEIISIELLNDNSKVEFGKCCFNGATELKIFNLKGGDVIINNDAFKSCASLQHLFVLGASKVEIGDNQLANLKQLYAVVIESESNVTLGIGCFMGLDKLESVEIKGKDTISISNRCFMSCSSLNSIDITGATNLTIGNGAFCKCSNLPNIDFGVSETMNVGDECFKDSGVSSALFNGETVEVGKDCFKKVQSITLIDIKARDIKLGNSAFEECLNLRFVRLESTLKLKIGDSCFSGDKNIQQFELAGETINAGNESFYKCASIPSLNLSASKQVTLSNNAFEGCTKLSSIAVTAADEFHPSTCCFSGATNLSTVQITSKKVTISKCCFLNCQYMTSFTILTAEEVLLGEKSFEGCKSLGVVDVTSSNRFKAASYCFNKAGSLKTVKISSKEILFGGNCFGKCSSLSTIDCPSATKIYCFQSSFNGNDYKKYLRCPPKIPVKFIKNDEEEGDDSCLIF